MYPYMHWAGGVYPGIQPGRGCLREGLPRGCLPGGCTPPRLRGRHPLDPEANTPGPKSRHPRTPRGKPPLIEMPIEAGGTGMHSCF